MVAAFIPGVELNRHFHAEVIQPLLATRFPALSYSAGLLGYGSDVLGYDNELSTDHEWGPRLLVFLSPEDHRAHASAIDETFRRELPATFRGYSTNFSVPAVDGGDARLLKPAAGEINHHILITTSDAFLEHELGIPATYHLAAQDWLTFPEQKLLEVTAGAVYHDGLEQLIPLRQQLAYYPPDVWRYRFAAQWQRISQEEAFVGRCGDVGDDLGSRLVATRLVRDLMRLCFLLERRYAPYSKWLGTAFSRLACAKQIAPLLSATLAAATWSERENHLADAYTAVATMQNALGVVEPQDPTPRHFHNRPYRVLQAERFAQALAAAIQEKELRRILGAVGLVGAVDQFVDSTDVLADAGHCRRLGSFYDE